MSKSENILVLTTREYDYWASMQEILPALEGVWEAVGTVEQNRIEFLHVDAVENAIDGIQSSLAAITRVVLRQPRLRPSESRLSCGATCG